MATDDAEDNVNRQLMALASERGLLREGWQDAWWWRDRERLRDFVACLGFGAATRIAADGGNVWAGWNVAQSCARYWAVSAESAGSGAAGCDDVAQLQRWRKEAGPAAWVSWWDARTALAGGKRRRGAAVEVADWVGGVTSEGAVVGRVVVVAQDGQPVTLRAGDVEFAAEAGVAWFKWGGEARGEAARLLATAGEYRFPSYLSMRAKVVATARQLVRAGLVANDGEKPLVLSWKRGPKKPAP
jgi:hypothetical protein